MPFYNEKTQELLCKLVYWGAESSGKTANLQWLAQRAPAKTCGKLAQLATETERTVFFEFLPLTLGALGGVATRFHLYTVPGQAPYQTSRRAILRGADGVVFVADARPERQSANLEALHDLRQALAARGPAEPELPLVFQCNAPAQGPAVDLATCCGQLGLDPTQAIAATAEAGVGVVATLVAAAEASLAQYAPSAAP